MNKKELIARVSGSKRDPMYKAIAKTVIEECWPDVDYEAVYTLPQILEACCVSVGCTVDQAKLRSRKGEYVRARHLYYYMSCTRTGATLREMGELVGSRDHSTSIHGKQKIMDMISISDPVTLFDLENIERILSGMEPLPFMPLEASLGAVKTSMYDVVDMMSGKIYRSVSHLCQGLQLPHILTLAELNKRYRNRFYRRAKV